MQGMEHVRKFSCFDRMMKQQQQQKKEQKKKKKKKKLFGKFQRCCHGVQV